MKLKWLGSLQDLTGNHVVALFVNDAISKKLRRHTSQTTESRLCVLVKYKPGSVFIVEDSSTRAAETLQMMYVI
jgi:hypothetical protein